MQFAIAREIQKELRGGSTFEIQVFFQNCSSGHRTLEFCLFQEKALISNTQNAIDRPIIWNGSLQGGEVGVLTLPVHLHPKAEGHHEIFIGFKSKGFSGTRIRRSRGIGASFRKRGLEGLLFSFFSGGDVEDYLYLPLELDGRMEGLQVEEDKRSAPPAKWEPLWRAEGTSAHSLSS